MSAEPGAHDAPLLRRVLDDGRILELWRMIFTWRITVSEPQNDGMCYEDCWCYDKQIVACAAFLRWDGEGEPVAWIKHPPSGRRRPDGTPQSEEARDEAPVRRGAP